MMKRKLSFDFDMGQLAEMFGESVLSDPQKTISKAIEFYASSRKYESDGVVYFLNPQENSVEALDAWGVKKPLSGHR